MKERMYFEINKSMLAKQEENNEDEGQGFYPLGDKPSPESE